MVAALVWMAGVAMAWGQDYVTGDKYVLPSVIIDKTGTTDNGNPMAIFDGDDETWWAANQTGPVTITLTFKEDITFNGLSVHRSGNPAERATQIEILSSTTGADGTWSRKHLESNINRDGDRTLTFSTSSITARFVRLVFTPITNNKMAINEVRFTGVGSIRDELYIAGIEHKPAKWYDIRNNSSMSQDEKDMDTFDDEQQWFRAKMMEGTPQIQATHTYIDTIYVHKGSKTRLVLPDLQKSSALTSVPSYQRWYSYRTDKTYETNHTDNVYDLLTPVSPYTVTVEGREQTINPTVYRFENGYVGNPVAVPEAYRDNNNNTNGNYFYTNSAVEMDFYFPTNDEFKKWFTAEETDFENNWYMVACDVSSYTDYTPNFDANSKKSTFYPSSNSDGNIYEPTLTHRVLFYIVGVDEREGSATASPNTPEYNWYHGHGRLKREEYQEASTSNYTSKKFLEEYDITFPYTRVSNKTLDLVALSKDARSYAIPDVIDSEELTVEIVGSSNTAGISLKRPSSGKPDDYSSTNLVSYSSVTGTTRIIPFAYPDNDNGDGTKHVNSDNSTATILVTKKVGTITYNIARFNLTFVKETQLLTQQQVNELENPKSNYKDKYWYVSHRSPKYLKDNYRLLTELTWDYDKDASTIYGQDTYYPFPMKWDYSSYSFYDGSRDNRSTGVSDAGDHMGQNNTQWGYYSITSDYIEVANNWDGYGNKIPPTDLGKGESSYHMYIDVSDRPGTIARLSFRDKLCAGSELFVSAWVKSAGTSTNNDAGMLFTIMGVTEDGNGNAVSYTPIYRHATGQIRTSNLLSPAIPGCGGDNNQWFQVYFSFTNSSETLANFDSYVLQIDNNSASTDGGDVYLDDIQVYIATTEAQVEQKAPTCGEETLLKLEVNFDPLKSRTNPDFETHYINFCFVDSLDYVKAIAQGKSVVDAIEMAHREFAYPTSQGMSAVLDYGRLAFDNVFENIKDIYVENGNNYQDNNVGADGANPSKFFKVEGTRNMAVDIYAELEPFRKYFFVVAIAEYEGGRPVLPTADSFKENLLDPCAIVSGFSVTSQDVIKVNGNVLTSDMEFCAGQVVDFSVQMEATTGTTTTPITQEVFYDWIYVDEEEFEKAQTIEGESGTVTLKNAIAQFRAEYPRATEIENATGNYTEPMQKLLSKYYDEGKLTLFQSSLSVRLPQAETMPYEFHVMVCPNSVLYRLEGGDLALVCAEPVHVSFEVTGQAPTASIGFNDVTYPDTDIDFRSVVRIGLDEHINQIKQGSKLTIPLRNIRRANGTNSGDITLNKENHYVYLVSSNDPIVINKIAEINKTEIGFRKTDWPVGMMTEQDFVADINDESNNYFSFYFDYSLAEKEGLIDDFHFREGFWYTLEVYFSQVIDVTSETKNICDGNLSFNMKVVPEYQRWIGDENSNWNKDENWVRSYHTELKKSEADYKDYEEEHRGFVPMEFTKVTIPKPRASEAGKIRLYAPASSQSAQHPIWDLTTSEVSEAATPQIQYDLLVKKSDKGSGYECDSYYTNTVLEIHFEPATEMLHAELLDYDKAWVDYELTKGRWYTLASPLQGVVAGDFYTDESGTEGAPYFSDITFADNRLKPAVYQRAWGNSALMALATSETPTPQMAISGNWSSVYNDVTVPYEVGHGFSLKTPGENTETVLFRMPKADTKYNYYTYNNGTLTQGGESSTINKSNAGKLKVSDVTVELSKLTAQNGTHYLVGNPYMAHLDADAFFIANPGLLKKYWLIESTEGSQEAIVGTVGGDFTTNSPTGKTTIAPLQSFFVTIDEDETTAAPTEIKFTTDMQVLGGTDDNLRSTDVLYLTATTQDGRQSRAAISYDAAASETYAASEDAELFLDSNLGDLPMVYTAAGTMAASINRTSGLYNIPVGVYAPGAEGETVSLTFSGTDGFSYATLYDAETRTESPIREGSSFTVPANTAGRYFLRAGVPTANEAVQESAIRIYTVGGGTLVVASTDLLRTVRVYDFAGRLVANETGLRTTQCRIELPEGSYIVKAESERGEEEEKIRM